MTYKVIGAVAVIRVGETEEYLYTGAVVPEGADAERVRHLLDVGLIGEAPDADPIEPAVVETIDEMKLDELRAYAAERGIKLGAAKKIADVRAAITAAAAPVVVEAPGSDVPLVDQSVDELRATAAARGIEIPDGVTESADLIALIEQ